MLVTMWKRGSVNFITLKKEGTLMSYEKTNAQLFLL